VPFLLEGFALAMREMLRDKVNYQLKEMPSFRRRKLQDSVDVANGYRTNKRTYQI
jgi:hypothetical protein